MMRFSGAPKSKGAERIYQLCTVGPYIVAIAIGLYFRTWPGAIAAIAVGGGLASACDAILRRIDAKAAFAAWGQYLDPGFTEKVDYETTRKRAPRLTGTRDADDHYNMDEWLLADGAILDCLAGERFKALPDARYLAARCDKEGASFALYDQQEHVSYDYQEADARDVFAALFGADSAKRAAAIAAVLGKADRTPLVAWRGLWLNEGSLPDLREDVLRKELAPRLKLTATLALPADCSTLDDPAESIYKPVRRLGVNGFATPYLCENLSHALASEDGASLIVKGAVIYDDMMAGAARWYYRGRDSTWTTLEECLRDDRGTILCRLLSIKALTATEAVFEIDKDVQPGSGACLQASSRALPFKVAIDKTTDPATCVVPLQKFL